MMRVGWVGLGAMGDPMARVAARSGITISGFDVDESKRSIVEPNFTFADGVSAAAADAAVLAIMVASRDQVESVLFGADPAVDVLSSGSVVLIMSTVGPSAMRDWAERLEPRGISVIDAPVSGGVSRAQAGELLVMVAGDELAIGRTQTILNAIARLCPVVGPNPGDAQKVKLVNNLLGGIHIAAAAEALNFAEALDLDVHMVWEVLQGGAAASFMFSDRGSRMVSGSYDDVRSALNIFVKDMGLVSDLAADVDCYTPLATKTRELFLAGRDADLGRLDDSSLIEVFRARTSAVATE